jgi:hypothetical protein
VRDPVTEHARTGFGDRALGGQRRQLGPAARAHERQRPSALDDEIGQHPSSFRSRRTPDRRIVLTQQRRQRRFPQREGGRPARGGIGRHRPHREPDQAAGRLPGGRDAGGGQDEHRRRAVVRADASQPAQDMGHVRAEQAAVGVAFIDHDVAQPTQERGPPLVLRQDRAVHHVGIGQHPTRVRAHPIPLIQRGVAVIGRRPDRGQVQRQQRRQLVTGQRFRRGQVEHPGPVLVQQRGQCRQEVGQRFTRPGAGGHHHGLAAVRELGRLHLMGPGQFDAAGRPSRAQQVRRPVRPLAGDARTRGQRLDVGQRLARVGQPGHEPGQQSGAIH